MKTISYALTEKQVEQLAASHHTADAELIGTNATYLRVLITAAQSQLGTTKGRRQIALDTQVSVLESVNAKYYAAVLRGVTTPDIEAAEGLSDEDATTRSRERNRRSTFARSAKSTIAAFVNAGGDLRTVDVQTVTKASLRAHVNSTRDADQLFERTISRSVRSIEALFTQRAREHPDEARAGLAAVVEELQSLLSDIGIEARTEPDATTTLAGAQTMTGRGFSGSRVMPAPPQIHRGA